MLKKVKERARPSIVYAWFSEVFPGPAPSPSPSPTNFLDMSGLRLRPRPAGSETLGAGPVIRASVSSADDDDDDAHFNSFIEI